MADVLLLQLSTWGPLSGSCSSPILFGSFGIFNVRACWRKGQNNNAGCYVLPWRSPIVVLLSFCLSCFWPLTWTLNVVWLSVCRGRRLQCWSIDAPMYSNLGYVERSFSVVWWILRRGVKVIQGMVRWMSGDPIPFSWNLFIWTKKIQFVTSFFDFADLSALSLPSTVASGLNFECLVSWKVSHARINDGIQVSMLKTYRFYSFTYFGSNSHFKLEFFRNVPLFLQMLTR